MEEQNKITTNSVENKPEMVEQLEAMDLNHPSEESNSANPSETIEMATQPESQPETEPTELVETEATVEGPTEEEKESVESDESHSQELPDFHEMSTDELLLLAEKVLTEKAISELKPYFEGMKAVLEPRFDADYKQAEEQFLEAGGILSISVSITPNAMLGAACFSSTAKTAGLFTSTLKKTSTKIWPPSAV